MTNDATHLAVGEFTENHDRSGTAALLDPADFTTHGVIVGMTGSGKTGLGVVLLEETLRQDIPVLVLDPKGDMGNLLLSFPELRPDDFAPWVPAGSDPASVAATWTDGLAGWGLGPDDIAALRNAHPMAVYTPGSEAGIPIDLIGSMDPPGDGDAEARRDEIEAIVGGLLGLVGINSDPLSGREHILMANILDAAWSAGESLDLAALLARIADPPMRKLGVIDVDTFFPRDDRMKLMMQLNGLLASPAFASWSAGVPLDIEELLWDPQGRARCSVIYMAHLSDDERQMVVTRILSKLVGWMRAQSGSSTLRALVYMDEVFGFVPPTATPPAKKPILTLLKQARAFGVGLVLSTQNPVDLDYKAISNAGTWMIGRLQTERDKQRLLEGMTSASGAVDIAATDAVISSLDKREFLLHSTRAAAPRPFSVRWAMSYLCGPLSKDQLALLPGQATAMASASSSPSTPTATTPTTGAPTATPETPAASTAPPPPETAEDESPTMPTVADGIEVRYLDPAAPWAAEVGAAAGGRRLQAAVAIRASLLYDDSTADVRHTETWEAVYSPLSDSLTGADAMPVDYDDRDLGGDRPEGTVFVLPDAKIKNKTYYRSLQTALKDHLVRSRTTTVFANRELKIYGRPGESEEDFRARCAAAADDRADAEADKLREKIEVRRERIQVAIDQARERADQLAEEASMSTSSELLSGAGSVLGALFGGRRSARSISAAANRAAGGRRRSQKAKNRTETALARAEDKQIELDELEADLADDLADIVDTWDEAAQSVETLEIPLEKTDIGIDQVVLMWVPTG